MVLVAVVWTFRWFTDASELRRARFFMEVMRKCPVCRVSAPALMGVHSRVLTHLMLTSVWSACRRHIAALVTLQQLWARVPMQTTRQAQEQ